MWRYTFYLCFYMFIGCSFSVVSSEQTLLKISSAFNKQKTEEAFRLAEMFFDELAGTPEFDALYGKICLKLNKIDEAVFAFERAVSEKPNDYSAYYLLALSYAKQKNLNQSEQTLSTLLLLPIPKDLRINIEETLRFVKNKRQSLDSNISQRISLNLGHDSNVNSGSLDDRVVVSGIEILLDEASLESSDKFARFGYELNGKWQNTQYDAWRLNLNLSQQTHHKLTQFNRNQANIGFGYEYAKSTYRFNLLGLASVMSLDEATYQQQVGIASSIQFQLLKSWALEINGKASLINNAQNENLDSDILEFGLGFLYFEKSVLAKVAFLNGKQNADLLIARHYGRDYKAASVYFSYNLPSLHAFVFSSQFKKVEHHDIHPFFLILRDEKIGNASLEWRYNFSRHWQLQTRFSHFKKSSNLAIYEFDRNELYLGASYEF
ncbi:tetratricopeptide repeat protein [Pseudoalteromonas sp. SS15]|uniref:tetratricopeptide repeat protein n=1 Tax=Pseudoalteromonas sp. SS15 TaxID=3139393 RepID=UPI003BAAB657